MAAMIKRSARDAVLAADTWETLVSELIRLGRLGQPAPRLAGLINGSRKRQSKFSINDKSPVAPILLLTIHRLKFRMHVSTLHKAVLWVKGRAQREYEAHQDSSCCRSACLLPLRARLTRVAHYLSPSEVTQSCSLPQCSVQHHS